MKCPIGPHGGYHLLVNPKFTLTIYDCQCQVANVITGSIPFDVFEDIKAYHGEQVAKDGWWEFYLWLKEQERLQNGSSMTDEEHKNTEKIMEEMKKVPYVNDSDEDRFPFNKGYNNTSPQRHHAWRLFFEKISKMFSK